jgi:hypothetical protein
MVLRANTKADTSTLEISHLQHKERERRNVVGALDGRNKALELRRRREVAVVVDGGAGGVGLDEERPLPVAVELEPPVRAAPEPPGQRVERHERLRQRPPHPLAVEEARVTTQNLKA